MKKSSTAWIWVIVIVIILIIIGIAVSMNGNNSANSAAPTTTTGTQTTAVPSLASNGLPASATTSQQAIILIGANNPTLGTYLIAPNGMTLYKYSSDSMNMSACTGTCAVSWPPYTVTAATPLTTGAGINGTVSTITRSDGTKQVTYNGMPLYFWKGDKKEADVTGQNVNGFMVVKP